MKFIDMFCGMGTIRMGFEQAGHACTVDVIYEIARRLTGVIAV